MKQTFTKLRVLSLCVCKMITRIIQTRNTFVIYDGQANIYTEKRKTIFFKIKLLSSVLGININVSKTFLNHNRGRENTKLIIIMNNISMKSCARTLASRGYKGYYIAKSAADVAISAKY